MTQEAPIQFQEIVGKGGSIGQVILNRAQSLNALTQDMCQAFDSVLQRWQTDKKIKGVVVRAKEEGAFCAGGDIRHVYEWGQAKDPRALGFFWDEYRLNWRIFHFSKPYISLLDGMTLGGGVGISIHGSHRIGTERMVFAMPECGIGFFPDVGSSYFLPRLVGETGVYMALTGKRYQAPDALHVGMLTHVVPSHHGNDVVDALVHTPFSGEESKAAVDNILSELTVTPELAPVATQQAGIDTCFAEDSVAAIVANLRQHNKPWAEEALNGLLAQSPTSLKVTLRQMREGVALDFDHCLQMEYRLVQRFLHHKDFYEGVRAQLMDKDRQPQWQPASLEEVQDMVVDSFFTNQDNDLALQFPSQ